MTSASGSAAARPSVLIVEDHAASAAGYEQLLKAHGYQVRVARDGYRALPEIARDQPSLVLLDLKVPKLDGWDLLDRLQRQGPEGHERALRVIVITGDALSTHHDLARSRGAHDVLTKPVEPPRLLRAIEAALS